MIVKILHTSLGHRDGKQLVFPRGFIGEIDERDGEKLVFIGHAERIEDEGKTYDTAAMEPETKIIEPARRGRPRK